uniref:Uncharacterized protein n=1 Tax=Nonomuraea gerenzanensis TaxID=93944 RepID=A0A1M4ED39_9ACTN|nr:hypothetical protein BN4615_P6198 [Nonomuraea gerenzanensis]
MPVGDGEGTNHVVGIGGTGPPSHRGQVLSTRGRRAGRACDQRSQGDGAGGRGGDRAAGQRSTFSHAAHLAGRGRAPASARSHTRASVRGCSRAPPHQSYDRRGRIAPGHKLTGL